MLVQRQAYCPSRGDHPTHIEATPSTTGFDVYRCPGRYTPSTHRMPGTEPAQPSDPFAGIDENTESDARRPAVS